MRKEIVYEIKAPKDIDGAVAWLKKMALIGLSAGDVVCVLRRPKRTPEQNNKYWPMIRDIRMKVPVYCNAKMSEYDYRDLFTGSIKQQTPVTGLQGGVVFIGGGSSRMDIKTFSAMIEMMYAFGADNDVIWSEKSKDLIDRYVPKK